MYLFILFSLSVPLSLVFTGCVSLFLCSVFLYLQRQLRPVAGSPRRTSPLPRAVRNSENPAQRQSLIVGQSANAVSGTLRQAQPPQRPDGAPAGDVPASPVSLRNAGPAATPESPARSEPVTARQAVPAAPCRDNRLRGLLEQELIGIDQEGELRYAFSVEGSCRNLEPEVETVLVAIAHEALQNVFLHASAGFIQLRMVYSPLGFRLFITDDGIGFNPGTDKVKDGRGIRSMHKLALSIGAALVIDASLGGGCNLLVRLPLAASDGAA